MSEESINFFKTIIDNFRDKDKKRIARYLYKSARQFRKEIKKELKMKKLKKE